MNVNEIKTETASIRLNKNGIIYVINNLGAEVNVIHAKEHVEATKRFGNTKHPIIVDISKIKSVTREAREYFASEKAAEVTTGIAVIVGSPVSKIVGNFLIGLNKPNYPIKLFTSEKKAKEWLQQFIDD
ncbi:MAG: hypothetical protein ACFFG0_09305 [Candidatus Thorarchaeota archaeon]